jgi:outer membrane protein OmpA-like peptidoglycan-associated protein
MASNQFPEGEDQGDYWISISDLMSGLMVIFLFVAVAYITNVAVTYQRLQDQLYQDLYAEFKGDLKKWGAKIDRENLSVRFTEPRVLFDKGEAYINARFRRILRDFFPRYIKVLTQPKYKDEIAEIRIEGHTSSEWAQGVTGLDAYIANMRLSQDRTRAVLSYVMRLDRSGKHEDWLIDHLTANGLSSSELILTKKGKEDKQRSRRVEFRVRTDAEKQIRSLVTSTSDTSSGQASTTR